MASVEMKKITLKSEDGEIFEVEEAVAMQSQTIGHMMEDDCADGATVEMKKITLKSDDGEIFEVEEAVAMQSQTIKHMMEDNCADGAIPLPNVTSNILAKVIEYCRNHKEEAADGENKKDILKEWDAEFVKLDQVTLFHLIMAANYLNIKSLLDLIAQTVADMIKGKTPEEIRETFNIKNDFTPDQNS